MYNPIVREVVKTYTSGKKPGAEYQEGLRQAGKAFIDMYVRGASGQGKVKPEHVPLSDLLESFCAPPGSPIKDRWGENAIESAAQAGYWAEVSEAIAASGDFNTLFTKHIHATFIPAYMSNIDDIMPLFTEVDSNNKVQYHGGLIDVDEPEYTPEGGSAPEGSPREKYVEIENYKVMRKTGITQETILYDKTGGQLIQRIRDLGQQSGRMRRRFILRRIQDLAYTDNNFNLSANTTLKYGGSTKALYSTDHSAIDKQTNSNTVTSATEITTPNIDTANQRLANMTDFYGRKISLRGDTILCGPDNWFAALKLTNSQDQFDTTDRSVNPVRVAGIVRNVIQDAEVAANTWYYGSPAQQFVWQWAQRPQTQNIGAMLDKGLVAAYLIWWIGGFGARDYRFMVKCSS